MPLERQEYRAQLDKADLKVSKVKQELVAHKAALAHPGQQVRREQQDQLDRQEHKAPVDCRDLRETKEQLEQQGRLEH